MMGSKEIKDNYCTESAINGFKKDLSNPNTHPIMREALAERLRSLGGVVPPLPKVTPELPQK